MNKSVDSIQIKDFQRDQYLLEDSQPHVSKQRNPRDIGFSHAEMKEIDKSIELGNASLGKQEIQDFDSNKTNDPLERAKEKSVEEVSSDIQQIVTEGNLFDGNFQQGRVQVARLSYSAIALAASKQSFEVKVQQQGPALSKTIDHDNGIFGAYCLEDVRSIATLVLKANPKTCLSYDCFNYETVHEVVSADKTITEVFDRNCKLLNDLKEHGKLNYTLHYQNKRNDLLQSSNKDNWMKFNRRYQQNMIFFNPYHINREMTAKLINAFFAYAVNHLEKNGVVTLMWNTKRKDDLANVDIFEIAEIHSYRHVATLSGKKFAKKANFTHFKNSSSLVSAKETWQMVTVKPKSTDMIYMFKHHRASSEIGLDNTVASTLIKML